MRSIQRALGLLGGNGGGEEEKVDVRKQRTRWKAHGLPSKKTSA